jgi:cyclopropane-fatty-acyl-phospholipid synthase
MDSLKPKGLALIHSIGQNSPSPLNPWIERRIFPGAYPPSLGEMAGIFEPVGFSVLDVENLRLHYAETLRHWLQRFEASSDVVRQQFGEEFTRAWRMYLTSSLVAFAAGGLQLYQVVFAHATHNEVPWTREHLYQHDKTESPLEPDSSQRISPDFFVNSEATTYGSANQ